MDLFDYMRSNTMEKEAPLASRLRPATLDEVVGQKHLLAPGAVLRRLIEGGASVNMVFYGPSGTGKTTVANIVADVIIGLSGQVRPFLKEDGLFLCSGIIDDRAEEVARHLREAGWDILRTRQSEGWFSYLCR